MAPVVANTMSFRALSQEWAQKQKEATEAEAIQKEKERAIAHQAAIEATRQRDSFRIIHHGIKTRSESSEEEEHSPLEDTTEPSDDEEEEVDDDWGTRKHRNELY